jgi:hypothetical protein
MRLIESWKGLRRFDFSLVLIAAVLAFVVVATVQFTRSLPGGERGLLLYERTCPIHIGAQ